MILLVAAWQNNRPEKTAIYVKFFFRYRTCRKPLKTWFMLLKTKHLALKVCIFGNLFALNPKGKLVFSGKKGGRNPKEDMLDFARGRPAGAKSNTFSNFSAQRDTPR